MSELLLSHHLTIVTYGGGEILTKIFQTMAMLFNGGQESFVRPLLVICASLGGFYAISKAFFSLTIEGVVLHYFFPLLVIGSCFLIPTTTVHIEDVLTSVGPGGKQRTSSYSINHVPLLLGKFAEMVSSIGYHMSEGIEHLMHTPNDASYNTTGMIFGSEASLDMTRYQLSNANLEQNLRLFSKQCVLYDIALGRYSLDDLKKETDLWKFFEEKTSQVRMIRYCPPGANLKQCSYETCKDAINKMKPFFEKEKEKYAKLEIGKNLPLTFQALTGLQNNAKELIGQQLTLNVLTDVLSKGNFAKKRAYKQQQSTYRTMGALAANGLVTMRIVFEALIYASFVFILPLSLFANGLKYLINWAWLVMWIQLWPPLYTILNYVMLLAARAKFGGWFNGLDIHHQGLSFFTSIGMQNLNDEIFALAGFLGASVPYLSYVLLKGGISSFVQLASSLTAPAQQAAGSAAAEQTSGNYSFANSTFGHTSFENTSAFQTQMAPSVSSGYFVDHQGDMTATYSQAMAPILNQSSSTLRTSLMSDASIGESFQTQRQEAQSYMENASENYLNSLSTTARMFSDMVSHVGYSKNYSDSLSDREGYAVQQSANYLQSIAEDWGKQYGFSARESLEILGSASIGAGLSIPLGKVASIDGRGSGALGKSASRDEVINSAQHVSNREDFQHHFQKINDFARNQAFSSNDDAGSRWSKAYADSFDQMHGYQDSYQFAKNSLEQVSENESWFKQHAHLIQRSLNDDFMKWANDKVEGGYSQVQEMLSKDRQGDIQPLIQEFIQDLRQTNHKETASHLSLEKFQNFNESLQGKEMEIIENVKNTSNQALKDLQNNSVMKSEFIEFEAKTLSQRFDEHKESHFQQTDDMKDKMQTFREDKVVHFDQKNDTSIFKRVWDGPDKSDNLSSKFKINEAPFWMECE